jgi:hypothetical protein
LSVRGLSAQGLANVAVGDCSNTFTFIFGDHRYWCPSYVAQFLSPRVSKLHSIDATVSELKLEVGDRDRLFRSVLETAEGGTIAVDSAHQRTFPWIYAGLWNSELVYPERVDKFTTENVVDHLEFLSANFFTIFSREENLTNYRN